MRKFGLIGYPLSHSFSQKYFADKFSRENIQEVLYENFPIAEIQKITELVNQEPELKGLNVTIPYKEQVIPFLHSKNDVVDKIGACNCIRIQDGKLYGYNTDVVGFEISLKKKWKPLHNRALVLGTGGAAKAVAYVLEKMAIPYQFVSRKKEGRNTISYQDVSADIVQASLLIINTTPLGMYPNVDAYPIIPYQALTADHYLYDLVYNPAKTIFLQKGEERGAIIENGAEMLVLQAEESWRIWNSDK